MGRASYAAFCFLAISGCSSALQGPVALQAATVRASERDHGMTWDPSPEALKAAKFVAILAIDPPGASLLGALPVPDWSAPDLTARVLVDGREVCRLRPRRNASTAHWQGVGLCPRFEVSEDSVIRIVVTDRDPLFFDADDAVGTCELVGPLHEHNVADADACSGALESVTLELRESSSDETERAVTCEPENARRRSWPGRRSRGREIAGR